MKNSFVRRFMFENLPLRGAFVILEDAWQTIAKQAEYPDGVLQLLGELLAANVLMTTNLKLDGKIVAQIQDNPKLDLVVSECSNEFEVRATAKFGSSVHEDNQISYSDAIADGRLVISIDSSGMSYQSIVALIGNDLATTLNEYMLQSEQLKTLFVLAYSKDKVVGFILQQLPDIEQQFVDEVERVFILASTLRAHELLCNDIANLLHKLFNEDDIVLFEPHSVNFQCRCGHVNVANMLRSLGKSEIESIIAELGKIEVTCDFCNSIYTFNAFDVHNMFSSLDIDIESVSHEVH